MCYLLITHGHRHRKRGNLVRSHYDIVFRRVFQIGQRGTHIDFDTLRRRLVYLEVVHTAHVLDDVLVEVIACHLDGLVRHDAAQRDNRNLRRAAAYVHNHTSLGALHINTDTYCCRHRLIQHIHIASAGMLRTVAHGAYLHLRATRRDSHHHANARGEQQALLRNHLYHASYHHLAGLEVGYHAFFERANGLHHHAAAAYHLLCFLTHGEAFVVCHADSNHRRLVHHHLVVAHNQRVRCA